MKTVDASGAVVNGYNYDVYGKKTWSTGSQANEFGFAGQQTDPVATCSISAPVTTTPPPARS